MSSISSQYVGVDQVKLSCMLNTARKIQTLKNEEPVVTDL